MKIQHLCGLEERQEFGR